MKYCHLFPGLAFYEIHLPSLQSYIPVLLPECNLRPNGRDDWNASAHTYPCILFLVPPGRYLLNYLRRNNKIAPPQSTVSLWESSAVHGYLCFNKKQWKYNHRIEQETHVLLKEKSVVPTSIGLFSYQKPVARWYGQEWVRHRTGRKVSRKWEELSVQNVLIRGLEWKCSFS